MSRAQFIQAPARPAKPLFTQPALWIGVLIWGGLTGLAEMLIVQTGGLPFGHMRPAMAGLSATEQLLDVQKSALLALVIMGVGWFMTRGRVVPNLATRAPARSQTWRELLLLVGYGVAAQVIGWRLGLALGQHPISLHLAGTLYGTYDTVRPAEVGTWAAYNFIAYALLPYVYFRRQGYSNEALSLKSNNPRADLRVLLVVLVIEAAAELFAYNGALFGLNARQLLLGLPLALSVNLFGTVLPIMVFLVSLIFPRLMKLSGSVTVTVLLGGLGYALLHVFESWAMYTSPSSSALSVLFVLLQYVPPGMVKVVLTVRTANAWVHALGYHAVAPHVTVDTPLLVKIFGLK